MRALVTGGTGFIGSRLCAALSRPVVLTRNVEKARARLGDVDARAWDATAAVPAGAMDGIDVVFHLAGDPVGEGRWNDEKRRRVRESRVVGTRRIVEAIGAASPRPRDGLPDPRRRVLVSASAVGYYGSRGDELLGEDAPPSKDFLGEVSREWEAEALAARAFGVRVVTARIGLVLGDAGGALAKMLPLFRLGLGGPLGSGKQWMPWIHVDDAVGLLLHAATCDAVDGPMNTTAPEPATNRDFTKALARALHRPAFFRAPELALKVALGDFADVVLASQRAVPNVALRTGYRFRYPTLDGAIRAAIGA